MTKKAVITATPEVLRELLDLPEGAIITDVRVPFLYPGVLEMVVEGAGWEVLEGQCLTKAPIAVATKDGDKKLTVDWGFPDEKT